MPPKEMPSTRLHKGTMLQMEQARWNDCPACTLAQARKKGTKILKTCGSASYSQYRLQWGEGLYAIYTTESRRPEVVKEA